MCFLVQFWHALHNDAKYLKKETFNGTEHDMHTLSPQHGLDFSYNARNTPHSMSMMPPTAVSVQPPPAAGANASSEYKTSRTPSHRVLVQRNVQLLQNKSVDRQMKNCLRRRQLLLLLVVRERRHGPRDVLAPFAIFRQTRLSE